MKKIKIPSAHVETADDRAQAAVAAVVEGFRRAITAHIDATAKLKQYDNAVSLASYATDDEPNIVWREEARAFIIWRSAVWSFVNEQLDLVLTGQRPQPTVEEFISELPVIQWS